MMLHLTKKKEKKLSEGLSSAKSTVCFSSDGLLVIIIRLWKYSFVAPAGMSSRTNIVQGWKTNPTTGSSAHMQVRLKGKNT